MDLPFLFYMACATQLFYVAGFFNNGARLNYTNGVIFWEVD